MTPFCFSVLSGSVNSRKTSPLLAKVTLLQTLWSVLMSCGHLVRCSLITSAGAACVRTSWGFHLVGLHRNLCDRWLDFWIYVYGSCRFGLSFKQNIKYELKRIKLMSRALQGTQTNQGLAELNDSQGNFTSDNQVSCPLVAKIMTLSIHWRLCGLLNPHPEKPQRD